MSLPAAWNDHEGGVLHYIADSRWGADGLPPGAWFGRVSAVVAAHDGRIVVFHRGPSIAPVVLFDGDGRHLASWDASIGLPHGMRIDQGGHLWLTDCGRHRVLKTTVDGEVLLELGTPDVRGTDERTFDMPTDVAFGLDGSIYVSDGYGNSRVMQFDGEGRFMRTWGRRGSGPGEFDTPHSIAVAPDGMVWVSDRHNHRLQVFEPDGRFVRDWRHLGATQGLEFGPGGELWAMTHRNIDEILSYDSISGRLMRLDPDTGGVQGSIETPGHMVHHAPSGVLWVASLSGTVIRLEPGWRTQEPGVGERFDEPGSVAPDR